MVDFHAFCVNSLKIDTSTRNGVKVRQSGAAIGKSVNFGVQGFQRVIIENQICQLWIFADEGDFPDEQERLFSAGGCCRGRV